MKEETDVLIVGAGLVGLSLAAALTSSKLKVTLLDARAEPVSAGIEAKSSNGYTLKSGIAARVSAVNPGSKKFLTRIGAWGRIAPARISTFKKMHVWDGRGTSHIEFGDTDNSASVLGDIVENQLIETALIETLAATGNIRLEWQAKLSEVIRHEAGYGVQLDDGRYFNCSLLVCAASPISATWLSTYCSACCCASGKVNRLSVLRTMPNRFSKDRVSNSQKSLSAIAIKSVASCTDQTIEQRCSSARGRNASGPSLVKH